MEKLKVYFTNEELGLPKDMVTGSKANISPDTKMPLASDRTMPYIKPHDDLLLRISLECNTTLLLYH